MTKKKPESTDSKLQLKTRQPGKVKQNYFGDFKARLEEKVHPLDEMFPSLPPEDVSAPPVEVPEALVNQPTQEEVNQEHGSVVNHFNESVNHILTERLTTSENVVNMLTKEPELLTKKIENTDESVNKLTTKPKVVNQQKSLRLTTEPKRSRHSEVVEGFRTSVEFKQKIKTFCAEKGIDKQDFYQLAVNHYFDCVVNQSQHNVVNLLTHDDLRLNTLWKTKPLIINLYLRYNSIFNEKSKWTIKDDDAGLSFNEVDIRIVELGILQTQANKNFTGKINSFNYYVPEIKNFIELKMNGEMMDVMLKINRQRWQQKTGRELDIAFLE